MPIKEQESERLANQLLGTIYVDYREVEEIFMNFNLKNTNKTSFEKFMKQFVKMKSKTIVSEFMMEYEGAKKIR